MIKDGWYDFQKILSFAKFQSKDFELLRVYSASSTLMYSHI